MPHRPATGGERDRVRQQQAKAAVATDIDGPVKL